MIRLIETDLPPFVRGNEPVSGRLLAWWEAYHGTPLARFFETEGGGGIGILDSQAVVCAPPSDIEEIRAFLAIQPELRTVYTTIPSIADGKQKNFTAMRANHTPENNHLSSTRLQELYEFLNAYFADLPPFEAWYLDVSYRTRHGLCRQSVIQLDGTIVSSAMTVAEWSGGALIGGVATHPHYRRLGYAGQCVNALTADLRQEGKTVWICPYNEPAHRLYQSLGFVDQGTVTLIERK